METIVRCERVSRVFDAGGQPFHALRGVELEVAPGELVAVVGASGSGKSTLLNVIGGLDRPSEGEVEVAGARLSELSEPALAALRNRAIGFVFQQFNLLPRHDARRNVELPMVYAGFTREERRRRAAALLERLGLAAHARKLPAQMSGGQQQRVAIARALALRPRLILADEPTGALDSATSREVIELLRELHRAEGMTVIIVTHDQGVAGQCERVVRFADGQIVEDRRAGPAGAAASTGRRP